MNLIKNNVIIEQAVILAGGLDKRIGNKSLNLPKTMQLFNSEPFLNNIIWNLARHGIKNIILSIDYLADHFRNYYGNGSEFGVKISYVEEEFPSGTAGALRKCESILEEYFLLIKGDTIFDINYHDLAKTFNKEKIGHLALNFVKESKSYVEVKTKDNIIISFKEK